MFLNQSNNNSSLVSTLMEAEESIVNPFIYNINKQIKFHGVQYVEEQAENASGMGAGKSIDFNISKFGFLRTCILKWTMTTGTMGGTEDKAFPRSGAINCIDRIEILSSSRRLAVLDKAGLLCAMSDFPQDVKTSYFKGLHMNKTGTQFVTASAYTNYLNLPFSFFNNVKNALPVSFIEPIKVRIYFSDLKFAWNSTNSGNTTGDLVDVSVSDPALLCEFRVLDTPDEDATIQTNYDGVLTQLNYDYETEVGETGTLTSSADLKLSKTLSTNVVAADIYVIVSADVSSNSSIATTQFYRQSGSPLKLRKIQFTASGQNIIPEIDANYLEYYGRREVGDSLFSSGTCLDQSGIDDPSQLRFVYKLQMGLGGDKSQNMGGVSLRELNSPTITVTVAKALSAGGADADNQDPDTSAVDTDNDFGVKDAKVTLRIVVRHHTLISTDPSSGRTTQLLTN